MIRVKGTARYQVAYEVELDITEFEFDALPVGRQNELIDNLIGFDEFQSAELWDLDVDDVEVIPDENNA
jgi:hypothetical protein